MRVDFTGIAAIDFGDFPPSFFSHFPRFSLIFLLFFPENWTPLWDNDGGHGAWHSNAYQQLSIELVKKAHPSLTDAAAAAQAKGEFEAAATKFFIETVKVCKEVRPNALWGFYGFPNP